VTRLIQRYCQGEPVAPAAPFTPPLTVWPLSCAKIQHERFADGPDRWYRFGARACSDLDVEAARFLMHGTGKSKTEIPVTMGLEPAMKNEFTLQTRRRFLRASALAAALPWAFPALLAAPFDPCHAEGANSAAQNAEAAEPLYKHPDAEVESRIADLLGRMSIEEKAELIHPVFFGTKPNARLGIPALKFIDGSYGVRCGRATSFCASVNHAATWNPDLINRVGGALAEEIKSKGRNLLLGPVITIHRLPQGGRNAESYSEDPYLAGTIATAHIKGVQSQKVAATADFFGAKTQEYHAEDYDVRVDERTLNEIYLPAFRMAVEEGKVWGIMTPYNRVNGTRASEHPYLLWDILKGKWRFPGIVMTDWDGAQNFEASIYSGLDLDMPQGHQYTVDRLVDVYKRGRNGSVGYQLLAGRLDESIRRILRVMLANGLFEQKPATAGFDAAAHRALSLQVARESIVLLKNESGLLPLDRKQIRSLAVIGPNANVCRHSILGASRVIPAVTVTPLEGIRKLVGNDSEVRYSQGCDIEDEGSLLPADNVTTPDGAKGFRCEFFGNKDLADEPAFTKIEDSIGYIWLANPVHPDLESAESDFSVRVTAVWTPEQSGYYHLFANSGTLSISLASHVSGASGQGEGLTKEDEPQVKLISGRRYLNLTKAKPYAIKAEHRSQDFNDFQIRYHVYEENALQNAVEAARRADVAVLFLGFSETLEREGRDRSPDLPENQLELLRAVLAVNRNVIVALNSGSGVSIEPWGSGVPAILEACYPGQEGGTAVAEVLFGDVNPSGKLPFTCMKKWADSPVYGHYPQGADEMVQYTEGIYVGYRWFDRRDAAPAAFPFGHGLSYTTFSYSKLTISPKVTATGNVECALQVTNTGQRAGAEVVQLYLGDDHASVDRPVKELKGYRKVFLNSPWK